MSKQIKVAVVLSYISLGITLVLGLIITPINLRLFGQAEYGLYSLAYAVMEALYLFDFGFSNAIIRYISQFENKKTPRELANLNAMFLILYTFLGLLAFAAGMALSQGAAFIFDRGLSPAELGRFKIMLMIVAVNLGLSFPLAFFSAIVYARERFIFARSIKIIRSLMNPAVVIAVLYCGYSSVVVLAAITLLNVLLSMINIYYCFKILKAKIRLIHFDFSLFKEIVQYSLWIFVSRIVDILYSRMDLFILGAVANSKAVAIYAVVVLLNSVYSQLTLVIGDFLLPKVVQLVGNDISDSDLSNLFIYVSRIQFILAALILCGFALVGNEFVFYWAGPGYADVYIATLMLMAVRFFPVVQMLAVTILQAKNLHAYRSKVYLMTAVFNVLISIPLAKQYGVYGCALGSVIGITLNTIIINFYYVNIGLEMKRYFKEVGVLLIPMLLLLTVGAGLKWMLNPHSVLGIVLYSVLFTAMYMVVMFMFMRPGERQLLTDPLKRIIRYKVEY